MIGSKSVTRQGLAHGTVLHWLLQINHFRESDAIICRKKVKKTPVDWEPNHNRMIRARSNGSCAKLAMNQCYALLSIV